MDPLETLVRDSLATRADAAPDAGFLPRAVRVGVVRRRREQAAVAIGAVLGLAGLIIGLGVGLSRATGPRATEPRESGGGRVPAVVVPLSSGPGTPAVVTSTAADLSRGFAEHSPARVVWVATTLSAWYHLDGEPPPARDERVYVIELRGQARMTCLLCKGPVPVVGRFGISVVPVGGAGDGEAVVTDTDYPLWEIGTEYVLDGAF